jgi:hypothetical protein
LENKTIVVHPQTAKDINAQLVALGASPIEIIGSEYGNFQSTAATVAAAQAEVEAEDETEYQTYAEQEAVAEPVDPADEDQGYLPDYAYNGTLPKYYLTRKKDGYIKAITRAEYGKIRRQQLTRVYQRVPMCGHKFVPGAQPRHRNCESCWFTFFNVHGELTQSIEELFAKHGKQPIVKLLGPKVLKNFLKFMSTVAAFKASQEARAKAIKDAYVAPVEEKHGSTSTVTEGSGEGHKHHAERTHTARKRSRDAQTELFQEGEVQGA